MSSRQVSPVSSTLPSRRDRRSEPTRASVLSGVALFSSPPTTAKQPPHTDFSSQSRRQESPGHSGPGSSERHGPLGRPEFFPRVVDSLLSLPGCSPPLSGTALFSNPDQHRRQRLPHGWCGHPSCRLRYTCIHPGVFRGIRRA